MRIVGTCILAAVVFGIVHDLFSVSVCKPYLGTYHPSIGTQAPVLLALGWGFLATWWFGAVSGLVLAAVSRVGPMPVLGWRDLVRPLAVCLGAILVLGIVLWCLVYFGTATVLQDPSKEADRRLAATGLMHAQSYALAAIATLAVSVWAIVNRFRALQVLRASASVP
ncbi:MAG: hypothetical protein JST30_04125 [Armatimonadetes bacterium]|nr:hypothetical protein [Armatimonadota bacterium]